MTLDPAELVTEIDTAIDAVPGAATPSRSSLAQDIVEALWAAVIDHFVDRPFAGSDPGLVPSSDGSTSKFLRGDGTFAEPSGGDGWTYLVLTGSDFTTSNGTGGVTITGLSFTPDASATYTVEGKIIISSLTAGVAAQVGVAWPGGLAGHGGFTAFSANITTANTVGPNVTQGTTGTSSVASHPSNTDGYLALVYATFSVGASPTGTFDILLESEFNGTNVAARIGSHIRYRKIIG